MRRMTVLAAILLLSMVAWSVRVSAVDGTKGKLRVYSARVTAGQPAQGDWYFKVELEPVLFRIVGVQNKYRVLRINIFNRSDVPLRLSASDRVQVQFAQSGSVTTVNASVDLAQSDNSWWKSLAPDLQSALSYPDQAPIRKGEEENAFAFIPIANGSTLPSAILFTVSTYSSTPIQLREVGTARE